MSAPVSTDVLAVLDYSAETFGQHGWNTSANALIEARAAVAELMESAAAIVEHDTDSPAHNRVLAALARCGGKP